MINKKSKRIDARRAIEGEVAAKRQKFFETGAAVSIILLVIFVIAVGITLAIPTETKLQQTDEKISLVRNFLIFTAIILMLSAAMGMYIAAYQPRVVRNHLRGSVLLAAMLIMIVLAKACLMRGWSPYLIVIPVMTIAITVTIAYSQRFALGISAFLAMVCTLLVAQTTPTEQKTIAVMLAAGSGAAVAILCLKEIRTRSKLIEVCALAAVVVFAMGLAVGLWKQMPLKTLIADSLIGAAGAVSVGFLMQGLLPVIEKVFQTATAMTLLDYSEANKPLLKRLALEAPGTFNHSWQLGMMAESAAEAIGANGLLCRVGCYYHDIGKLNKPRYFVENQAKVLNQHKELSPTMSRMIIIGHVKDGLALAQEYKLPKVLHQFIEAHHGTTLVEYFFHEATKKEAEAGRSVVETEFRYPGPKPATKESAIVMVTDVVEGATRAMQEPTPNRIEDIVHKMAMKRLLDGQFDECDLTMKQLTTIEESLVKSLCGMYHSRISYPKTEKPGRKKNGAESA